MKLSLMTLLGSILVEWNLQTLLMKHFHRMALADSIRCHEVVLFFFKFNISNNIKFEFLINIKLGRFKYLININLGTKRN